MYKDFNPLEWADRSATSATSANMAEVANATDDTFPQLIAAIEAAAIDLTADYTDWFRIGCAIARTYGEQGRDYFHRISKFHNSYTIMETDKKYDDCLRDPNQQLSLGTIFHLAKQAGITLTTNRFRQTGGTGGSGRTGETLQLNTALLAEPDALSDFLQAIMKADSDPAIQNLLLFGSLVSLSSVMPSVSGIYGGKRVYPNLYGFVVAPPASSKGKLADVIQLVKPIDDEIRLQCRQEQEQYQLELAKYKADKNPDAVAPKQPPLRKLLLPANASSTALYQALNDNHGRGLTFETEGDTVSLTLKSDYGNYSDGLRKAFHHEAISYMRRKDAEDAYIAKPRWSVLLSGTPAQVTTFIPNSENGLFSRFIFYCVPRNYDWMNVFATEQPMEDYFADLGERYLPLYHELCQRTNPLTFRLTADQQRRFNDYFAGIQSEYAGLYGDDLIASIRRLGLICFRIAMVLSVTRLITPTGLADGMENVQMLNYFTCSDEDFCAATNIVETLMQHTAAVYANLLTPIETTTLINTITDRQRHLYDALPETFSRSTAIQIAAQLTIPSRTAERWIGLFVSKHNLLTRTAVGHYSKTSKQQEL